MSEENDASKNRMKPVIIVPLGTICNEDVKRLEDNGFVVVRSKHPEQFRFIDPPPMGYSVQEKAAISLCRWILSHGSDTMFYRKIVAEKLCQLMIEGSPLHTVPFVPPPRPTKTPIAQPKPQ